MDHHVHRAITAGLRRRGGDCVTAEEDGKRRLPDDQLLQRAIDLGRILYSNDKDLLQIESNWIARGREFVGVVFAEQRWITIGPTIAELETIALVSEPGEWKSRAEYLPL